MQGNKCVLRLVVLLGVAWCVYGALDIEEWKGDEPLTPERIVEEVVDYFSQRDPHGIPVLDVPEIIELPDRLTASQITLWDIKVSGHSGIRLEYINVNLTTFSGVARISVPWVNVVGEYSWPGWWTTSQGATNITMAGIEVVMEIFLGVDVAGILTVQKLQIVLNYEDLDLNFENLSTQHSFMVGAADVFFGTFIQPLVVGTVQHKLMQKLNERLRARLAERPFPDSISPVDFAVAKVRGMLREKQLDPIMLGGKDVTLAWGVSVQLKNFQVSGLATIHRTHEVSAQFIDNAIFITIQIGTQKVKGGTDWSMSAALLPAVGGHLDLEVESLAVTIEVKQPANIRSPPTLRKIDVQLGNVAVTSPGEGTMDYMVEAVVNVLPNALRNAIMDRLEPKIQQVIQNSLNGLDLYRIVMDQLAKTRLQEHGGGAETPTSSGFISTI
ncbi:uncharacterized protein [Panulirus ornatus]|uniref:uncharacterized protein n=1 Tax=Panulirus ornatus TaxID=150431 RepID=UPI003A85F1B5